MGLIYFGGNALLNYVYNDDDLLEDYDSFEIQLVDNNSAGYAGGRQSVVRGDDATFGNAWNINGINVTNKNDIQFPPLFSNAPAQTLTKFNIFIDGISATKKAFASGTLNTPIVVQAGETPIIRAYNASSGDGLEINIDETNKYTSAFREKIYKYLFLAEDSLNSVINYRFNIIDTQGAQQPLEFIVARRGTSISPNWTIAQISEGSGTYAEASNLGDLSFGLNEYGNVPTNLIRMFYGEGDFPNETYTSAGSFFITATDGESQITTTINDGETARLQAGQLRINSK